MKRRFRRLIRVVSISLISASIILFALVLTAKILLQRNNITFESLQFSFPHQLKISGIRAFPDSSISIAMESLDIEWSWTSLMALKPRIYGLNAQNACIFVLSPGSSDTSEFKLPEFSLYDINFSNINLEFITNSDTIFLDLKSLYLSKAVNEEELLIDTLSLAGTHLSYNFIKQDKSPAGSSDFDFTAIPGFRVNLLHMEDCAFTLDDQEEPQSISKLNLAFTGWKSSDLFDAGVEMLSLTYQDTLDLEIVMEDGKLNQDFQADLKDLNINIPGINLKMENVYAETKENLQVNVRLADSYLAFGRLFQLYPDIAAALDPGIPPDSLIYLRGNIAFFGDSLYLDSVQMSFFDSTFITASGYIDWSGEFAEMNLDLYPLETSNTNLYLLLTEQGYNDFFTWPTNITGKANLSSTPVSIDIKGDLQTQEGYLSAKSIISIDTQSDFVFSLALQGDSLLLDQFVTIIPDSIPYGDVDFFLSYSGEESKGNEELLIDVYSRQLFAYGKLLNDIDFRYYFDYLGDSITATVNDDSLKVKLNMYVPPGEGSDYYFEGGISDLHPGSFHESLPEGIFSTLFKGSFNIGEENFRLKLGLSETGLDNFEERLNFPESEISMQSDKGEIHFLLQSDGREIIKGRTGTEFPEFYLPYNEWLSNWPEMDLEASLALNEDQFPLLTGQEGSLDIQKLQITKKDDLWRASLVSPVLSYAGINIKNLNIDMDNNIREFSASLLADSLGNSSVSFSDMDLLIGYSSGQYSIKMANVFSETRGLNEIALLINEIENGYNLRFDDREKLVIDSIELEIARNHGLDFSDSLQLLYGDLAISKGPSRLEAATKGDVVNIRLDSLDVTAVLEYLTQTDFMQADLGANASYSWKNSRFDWEGKLMAQGFESLIATQIDFNGKSLDDELYSGFKLSHEDLSAQLAISGQSETYKYEARLDKFDLRFLELIPDLTTDLNLKGMITGQVKGEIGEDITADGYFITEQVSFRVPLVYTPVKIEKDTIFLKKNLLILNNFAIRDERGNDLNVDGSVNYYPVPEFNLEVKSNNYRLLNSNDTKALVNGNVDASTDLKVRGGLENLDISGYIKTLPGAYIKYLIRESFDLVDATQIVSFIDFTKDSAETGTSFQESYTDINWNVALEIAETRIEILLNEISQEYINLTGWGNLNLRKGEGMVPLVYGSFKSTSGTAFINPPAIPDLNLIIENANLSWNGFLDEPVISFEGYKIVKSSPRGLGAEFSESTTLEDFKVKVSLDQATLSQLDLVIDLDGETTAVKNYLQSLPLDTRQSYAINLLVFGRIGSEQVSGNTMAVEQVTNKLNEIARRNLKNSDISFTANSYREGSLEGGDQLRTDLSYSIRKGFLNNRLSFSVGGSVGIYMDNMSEPPPANLLGNIQIDYKLLEKPSVLLRGSRKDVYHGIIDGDITETSLGLYYQRTWPRFDDFLKKEEGIDPEKLQEEEK